MPYLYNDFWGHQPLEIKLVTITIVGLGLASGAGLIKATRHLDRQSLGIARRCLLASIVSIWLSILALTYGAVPTYVNFRSSNADGYLVLWQSIEHLLQTLTLHFLIAAAMQISSHYVLDRLESADRNANAPTT